MVCISYIMRAYQANNVKGFTMYEITHYDDQGRHFQTTVVNNNKNLEIYKDVQVSKGETIYIYCAVMGNLIETFSK